MRRSTVTSVLSILALSLVAAAPAAEPAWTPVAEEDCVAGPDLDDGAASDWEDMCSVAWRTVTSGAGVPTTIEIQLRAVGSVEDRAGQTLYSSTWEVGDCSVVVEHRDGGDLATDRDVLWGGCGLIHQTCDVVGVGQTGVGCHSLYEVEVDTAIAPPVFEGNTVTWRITFDGALEPLAAFHRAGTTVTPRHSYAGDSPTVENGHVAPLPGVPNDPVSAGGPQAWRFCILGLCSSPLDERITADRTFTIQ